MLVPLLQNILMQLLLFHQETVDQGYQIGNFRLGNLRICAQLLTFDLHFFGNQRREQDNRETLEDRIFLDQLGEMVPIHLGHFDICYYTADMVFQRILGVLYLLQEVPCLLAVIHLCQVLIPCAPERFDDHF